ncbi:TolC family protein [Flavobacterium urocaniciphilum]|uniref:Outer membrane protein TolC n=1 Tax=Flavobacterium urocaniciphilum TaxID=1299341 RepID=A0A1H8ZHZ1_9FLAO|nr:TolC family protein [Flavobacterium urocaniciphilum]SEP64149.1 Outer membrane protein TolC [Flavobacterium urocaniciphilum]
MNINKFIIFALFSFGFNYAQENKTLSLKEAINIGITKSNQAILADTKVKTSEWDVKTVKNNQLPSASVSGQFFKLTKADVKGNLIQGSGGGVDINQLMIGQANVTVPVFNGFKIQNGIKASQNLNFAEVSNAQHTKEQIALYVTQLYFGLYKTQQMIVLTEDNLKSAHQRVVDFQALEDNGLLAHNDLLKAQLQESNIELSLETIKKNNAVLNFQLVNFLQLAEGTKIKISEEDFSSLKVATDNSVQRKDLEALSFHQQAAQTNIKIAKGNYYPSFNLIGGYIALDVKNALTVTNAMNFGAGISYDLSSIFKNKKNVEKAKSQALEVENQIAILNEKITEEVQEATENYNLAIKQKAVYQKAQFQAEENYRIVLDKYNNGLSNTNDLLEANVEQLQAKINYAISTSEILQKYYELEFQKGKLTQSLN